MNIAILGYGKMGKIIKTLAEGMGHQVVLTVGSDNRDDLSPTALQRADVAIEFSRPEAAVNNLMACFRANIPVVSGTTGWLDRFEEVQVACQQNNGAFFYASNFSIGVNIFFALNRFLATQMNQQPGYDISLEEIHHTEKLDAPSGTAISLAEGILQEVQRKEQWVNTSSEESTDLSIISKRISGVPGTHEISYTSGIDTIEIKHTAHSREGFARGAIQAAEWLIDRQGCFGMKDLLGF